MKYTFACLTVFLLISSYANADKCDGLNAHQTVDCIIANASEDDDESDVSKPIDYDMDSQKPTDEWVVNANKKSAK